MILAGEAHQATEAIAVMREAQEISRRNGNSEMTLDEINEEIALTRAKRRNRK